MVRVSTSTQFKSSSLKIRALLGLLLAQMQWTGIISLFRIVSPLPTLTYFTPISSPNNTCSNLTMVDNSNTIRVIITSTRIRTIFSHNNNNIGKCNSNNHPSRFLPNQYPSKMYITIPISLFKVFKSFPKLIQSLPQPITCRMCKTHLNLSQLKSKR
jgi:hypothetical protein